MWKKRRRKKRHRKGQHYPSRPESDIDSLVTPASKSLVLLMKGPFPAAQLLIVRVGENVLVRPATQVELHLHQSELLLPVHHQCHAVQQQMCQPVKIAAEVSVGLPDFTRAQLDLRQELGKVIFGGPEKKKERKK